MDFNNTSDSQKLYELGQVSLLVEFQYLILYNKGTTLENL